MIKQILCFNELATGKETTNEGEVTVAKPKFSVGILLARLTYMFVGGVIGNTLQPIDRMLRKAGKPQLDKSDSLAHVKSDGSGKLSVSGLFANA